MTGNLRRLDNLTAHQEPVEPHFFNRLSGGRNRPRRRRERGLLNCYE